MRIERGTVWHTYTMQSPPYKDPEKMARNLIKTGAFLSILTPSNVFYYLENEKPKKLKLQITPSNNNNAISLQGHESITEDGVCKFTQRSLISAIKIRLSQNKILYSNDDFHSNGLICNIKPIVTKESEEKTLLLPSLRLFENGFSHVTFIDIEEYDEELSQFIIKRVNLPLTLIGSITTSLDYIKLSYSIDYSKFNLLIRLLLKFNRRNELKKLKHSASPISIGKYSASGLYVDYAEVLKIQHNLSDLARYMVAIVYHSNRRQTLKELLNGRDITKFFGGWQGKPNVYIFEHKNQKTKSLDNHRENKKLISSILARSQQFYNNRKNIINEYRDYRAFDDFNYFSEQSASLTLMSKETARGKGLIETYTEENLILDNQIKSDLRGLISFFYESKINEIKEEKTHQGLTKIQEDIIYFEEWLRLASKPYGEIQDYAMGIFKAPDINQAKNNVSTLLKARIQVVKLEDARVSERSNRLLTIAFGLIASTSLSPIIAKPVFNLLDIADQEVWKKLSNFEDAIYFLTTVLLVLPSIWLLNKISR
ncbi:MULTISPECIES: hypothetical protein [Serratia]|uniref:hypothetical protein n=1 Tax=Serratia TaxID=613 RepID=UPI00083E6DA7|nr:MULTISPECIES: hypothetical protein [Serratia]MBN5242671.1 hypothetical protein [Serratia ureilytica]ODJ21598.1 hypothetical protein BBC05_19910 [Serratia sp. ISTD04]